MNILVTGATGFIGKNLLQAISKDNEVHVLVRPSTICDDLDTKRIFVFNDNVDELRNYLVNNQIEGIVHLASLYITKHKNEQIKDLILSNVYFGTSVMEAAKQADVRWFINTGSYWQNYTPDSKEYRPVNLYAATKQAFVDIAKFYVETSNIHFVTLKICDTYGANDTRKKIMSLFKQYAESGEPLKMSPGEQKINLLYIDDVIHGFITLMNLLHENVNLREEYVLSAKNTYSLRELAAIFEQVSQKKLNIEWGGLPYREREVMTPWQMGDIVPGWTQTIDINQGINLFLSQNRLDN